MEQFKIEPNQELQTEELTQISGGIGWFVAGLLVYIAGEMLDGVLRYADGERAR